MVINQCRHPNNTSPAYHTHHSTERCKRVSQLHDRPSIRAHAVFHMMLYAIVERYVGNRCRIALSGKSAHACRDENNRPNGVVFFSKLSSLYCCVAFCHSLTSLKPATKSDGTMSAPIAWRTSNQYLHISKIQDPLTTEQLIECFTKVLCLMSKAAYR